MSQPSGMIVSGMAVVTYHYEYNPNGQYSRKHLTNTLTGRRSESDRSSIAARAGSG